MSTVFDLFNAPALTDAPPPCELSDGSASDVDSHGQSQYSECDYDSPGH